MPRLARLDTPGLLQHVMARGIERREVFRDKKERKSFLDRLAIILEETKTQCYAWALIPNHFHLLLRTGHAPLSKVMRRLMTGYAVTFNPAFSGTIKEAAIFFKTVINQSSVKKMRIFWNLSGIST